MFPRKTDPVKRRNLILILAGIFLMIAIIHKPSLLLFFTSSRQFLAIILIAAAGFTAAVGIYNFVEMIYGTNNPPWYAKPGALIFLAVALIIINAVFMFFSNMLSNISADMAVLNNKAYLYLFMAFELIWTVALEWVSYG